jgi:uncharacterized protein (TIGR02466 family)
MPTSVYFPTYIDHSKALASPQLNRHLKKEILQIREMDSEGQTWSQKNYASGFTSYGSMDQLHLSSPNFAELEKLISKKIAKFIKVLEWDISAKDLKMNSCWVNIMPFGSHHSFHLHPHSVISGTYYVDVPRGSSPLKFEDPRLSKMMLAPARKNNCHPRHKNFVELPASARDLILFESWLRHEVPAQSVALERISVSFNYS